jgi:alpha-tubulin suppressor-like RCC1 family protein
MFGASRGVAVLVRSVCQKYTRTIPRSWRSAASEQHTFPFPFPLPGVTATSISLGGWHTCALVSGGAIKCWGTNTYAQLGLGDTNERTSPADVSLGGGLRVHITVTLSA